MQLLQLRATSRDYSDRGVDQQTLSNLLWSAYGVSRPESGKRTAPSAHDWQYVDIYVSDRDGLYKFDASKHDLIALKPGDVRAMTGIQDFVAIAPISFVYVADESKMDAGLNADTRMLFAAATVGAIAQNVYLYCAAHGLETGVRADIERLPLQRTLELTPNQKIILAQSVGHPTLVASVKKVFKSFLVR